MKKLTLDLDALAVDSFDTDVERVDGTVLAHEEMLATQSNCLRTPCCPETYQPGCTGTG